MKRKFFALLTSATMLFSLAACDTNKVVTTAPTTPGTTAPTTDANREPGKILSQVRWLVDQYVEEVSCQYNEETNTLNITGEDFYPVEVLFYEGGKKVKLETVWDEDGNIYTQQEYNEKGQLISEQDAYGYQKLLEYDGDLLMKETVYQNDQLYSTVIHDYDDAGREIYNKEVINDGEEYGEVHWAYDDQGNLIHYQADSSYLDNHWYQIITHTYENGRLISSTYETDDPGSSWEYSVTYSYDDQGRKVGATYQDAVNGEAQDVYVYDDQGNLLMSVEHYPSDGWVEIVYEYAYDENGTLVQEYYKETSLSSGEIHYWENTKYTYGEQSSQPTEIVFTSSAEEVYTYFNEYDDDGNLIQEIQLIDDEEILNQAYTYDNNGKLVKVFLNDQEVLTGEDIQFFSGEEESDRYVTTQYTTASDAEEAAHINEYILQYIRKNY